MTFCCSFIPATTGTLQTVESLARGEEEPGRRYASRQEEGGEAQCADMKEECKAAGLKVNVILLSMFRHKVNKRLH